MLGYPVEQWREPNFWVSHLHPEDREWAPAFCEKATAARRAHQFDYRMLAADGRVVWLRDIVSVVTEGERLKLRGVMVDITLLKQTAAERDRLLAQERAARTAAEQAEEQSRNLAIRLRALADASLAFAEASVDFPALVREVVRQIGVTMGDACALRVVSEDGQWLRDVAWFHPDEARMKELQHALESTAQRTDEGISAEVLRTGKPLLVPVVTPKLLHARVKPEHWPYLDRVSSLLIVPLRMGGRVTGALALLRDRPGRPYDLDDQALLQDLAARAAQALEVSRLFKEAQEAIRARDEFLSVASHELRTPLTAALLQTQVLRRFEAAPERISALLPRGLAALETQLSRLTQLTDNLLDVSKLRLGQLELHLEAVELVELVREVVARHQRAISCSGSTVKVRGRLPVVGGWDRTRLDQVVTSLLTNALKFGEGRPIELVVTSDGVKTRLKVRDHGMGIPPQMQTRIFDRFERAVSLRDFGGLGLGLYVVRRIVEAHEGTVRVESVPGRGSTFIVELPLLGPAHVPVAPQSALSST